jgi:hypothetical protein
MTETRAVADPYPVQQTSTGGGAGTASLLLGILLVVGGIGMQIVSASLPLISSTFAQPISSVLWIFTVSSILTVLLGAAAIVLGVIGIQPSRARGRLAAAAGLALGVAHVITAIVGFVTPLVLGALY